MSSHIAFPIARVRVRAVTFLACMAVFMVNDAGRYAHAAEPPPGLAAPLSSNSDESTGVRLTSKEGEHYVGEQLRIFTVDQDGMIGATNILWFSLYYTEGRPFRLSGEVWLKISSGKPPHQDLPGGFALFIREWDSLHRYTLTSRGVEVKRSQRAGKQENKIIQVTAFDPPAYGQWIPFALEATSAKISFQMGKQSGVIPGPLDMDGANKIVLSPGTKLKNLRLELIEPVK